MRISKELRDVLADAVKGFKNGLKPVFNQWGDGKETACLITAAKGKISSQSKMSGHEILLMKGWDSAWGYSRFGCIYQAGERLGIAMCKLKGIEK